MLINTIPNSVLLLAGASIFFILLSFVWMVSLLYDHFKAYLRINKLIKYQRICKLQYEAFDHHMQIILLRLHQMEWDENPEKALDFSSGTGLYIDQSGQLKAASHQQRNFK